MFIHMCVAINELKIFHKPIQDFNLDLLGTRKLKGNKIFTDPGSLFVSVEGKLKTFELIRKQKQTVKLALNIQCNFHKSLRK